MSMYLKTITDKNQVHAVDYLEYTLFLTNLEFVPKKSIFKLKVQSTFLKQHLLNISETIMRLIESVSEELSTKKLIKKQFKIKESNGPDHLLFKGRI